MRANENDAAHDKKASVTRPATTPADRSPGLLTLQATAGNAAVVQMLRRAGHVPSSETGIQRATAVHDVLRTSGRPLDDDTRVDTEARLGTDFTDVRIHNDPAARASAAEIGARAYTSGNHIVLGDGGGDHHTLAHELTHVIQQRSGPVAGTDHGDGLRMSDPADHFEREAEKSARSALSKPHQRPIGIVPASEAAASPPSPQSGSRHTSVQRVTQAKVKEYMTKTAEEKDSQRKNNYSGSWVPDRKESVPRKMDPDERALRHISTQLFTLATKIVASEEHEVQSMYAKGSIFIAANKNATLTRLHEVLENEIKEHGQKIVGIHLATNFQGKTDERYARTVKYLDDLRTGKRDRSGAVNEILMKIMRSPQFSPIAITDETGISGFLGSSGTNQLVFVKGSDTATPHAEQKLVTALIDSNFTGEATIAGKKRPCTGCYICLSLAKEKKLAQLKFQPRASGLWSGAAKGIATVATRLKMEDADVETFIQDNFPGVQWDSARGGMDYGSESESESEQ
ncbi:DUF4157 domain-containing protein [Streptomyces sp. NEAU-sy36]|uniref:eCIS core domain-containing protein n=1 Tax=unclassified Streptomyces TaxID=2593676 RepID=UPI0015D5EA30|nr:MULTISPECIES: DUF4157 domain-containing protein [unclassified Streptomyces]QLJ02901.1 DUF4157 domain-containing protein [Streptomyces sp. NEAU-sy36]